MMNALFKKIQILNARTQRERQRQGKKHLRSRNATCDERK
jgi:hypothetical protein